jgi:EAL domain-containing protein (putative c-di-GMP-specific phosphodiesterase class I)
MIYAPFVITARISLEQYQAELFDSFRREATLAANNEMVFITNRNDAIGAMANQFVTEINMSLDNEALPFFLVYQPKSDKSGKVVGAEALLRWTHPQYGPIPPDIVIELTDEADLSAELGRWVLSTALEEYARWQERGLDQLILSINLNPNHIVIDAGFPEFVIDELERLSIDASQIDLEITEHVAVGANQNMLDMFHRLREIGLRLSIDDMGMGYSSLTYISDFGASVVKIDISLIDQVGSDFKQQEIVRSIVELAKQINLSVIVEGVETEEQLEVLDSLGCRYYQGYYFAKPLLPEDFLTRIEEHGTAVMQGEGSEAL